MLYFKSFSKNLFNFIAKCHLCLIMSPILFSVETLKYLLYSYTSFSKIYSQTCLWFFCLGCCQPNSNFKRRNWRRFEKIQWRLFYLLFGNGKKCQTDPMWSYLSWRLFKKVAVRSRSLSYVFFQCNWRSKCWSSWYWN